MSYVEPKAKILRILRHDGDVSVVIEVTSVAPEPLAPSGLYAIDEPGREIIELDKLKSAAGNVLTFETYDYNGSLPNVGDVYIHRTWWTPDELEAVTDLSRKWRYEQYPDNGDHEHCLLTWEKIAAYADQKAGYRSGRDWITEAAYNTYIVNDKLKLRHKRN